MTESVMIDKGRNVPVWHCKDSKTKFWLKALSPEQMVGRLANWEEQNPGKNILEHAYTYTINAERALKRRREPMKKNKWHDWFRSGSI